MTKQHDDIELIEDFLDGSLNKEVSTEIELRIKSDPAFAELYNQRVKLQQAWQSTSKYSKVRSRVRSAIKAERKALHYRRNILFVAASVVALIGVGSFLLFILTEKSPIQIQEAKIATDSIQIENIQGPKQIGIPKYSKSDTLEGQEVSEVELVSPADHFKFDNSDTIRFNWKSAFPESYLTIKYKDNDSLILRVNVRDGEDFYLLKTSGLKTGTYIWYVDDPKNSREFQLQWIETK